MKNSPVIFIKELSEQDRPFMLNHFLGLSPSDRRLRFGAALPDEAVSRYVQRIDFTRDTVFGVYESTYNLVGVGHLAFLDPVSLPALEGERTDRVAEFGVSVSAPMRRKMWEQNCLTERRFIAVIIMSIHFISIVWPQTSLCCV